MQAYLDTAPEKGSVRRNNWTGGEPEKGALAYLLMPFFELGPVLATDQGLSPINWQELNAWKQATQSELSGWESKAMIDLSSAYLIQHRQAIKSDCPAPFIGEIDHGALAARRKARRK